MFLIFPLFTHQIDFEYIPHFISEKTYPRLWETRSDIKWWEMLEVEMGVCGQSSTDRKSQGNAADLKLWNRTAVTTLIKIIVTMIVNSHFHHYHLTQRRKLRWATIVCSTNHRKCWNSVHKTVSNQSFQKSPVASDVSRIRQNIRFFFVDSF